MRIPWALIGGVALLTAAGLAQTPRLVEARLAELEARAARADALAARVGELEARLATYEGVEREEALEAAIAALVSGGQGEATVKTRRATLLTIGGELRLRGEYRTVSRYEAERPRDTDEDFVVQRTRVGFDVCALDHLRIFVEIQDSRLWGEELGVLRDLEGVDLHQGYADFEDLFGSGFTARVGRFELSLWNQRLLSPLDWSPVGRAWDGVVLFGEPAQGFTLEAGYSTIAEDPRIDSDKDTDFYWGAATYAGLEGQTLGAALFWLHSRAGTNDSSFGTVTLHVDGRVSAFDYAADLVAQFGENDDRDVHAYATSLVLGHTFPGSWKPRLGLEWTWASGDDDPGDDTFETFDPLFPFGHAYQGHLDIFSWRNGHDVAVHLEFRPSESWWVGIAAHGFWLDTSADAWYGADLRPIRMTPGTGKKEVGYELDVSIKVWMSKNVWLWFGYSHFFAADYVEATGASPDTDWFFAQLTAQF